MSVLAIMDTQEGDTRIMWDADRPTEVDAARAAFDAARSRGYLGYSVSESGERGNEVIREFDPEAEKIIMAPALRGG